MHVNGISLQETHMIFSSIVTWRNAESNYRQCSTWQVWGWKFKSENTQQ